MSKTKIAFRPFHKTIVKSLGNSYENGMGDLVGLIKATTIPDGHAEILAAIDKKWGHILLPHKWAREIAKLRASVLAQKKQADAEAEAKEETVETTFGELKIGDFYLNSHGVRKRKMQFDKQVCSVAVVPGYHAFASCPPDSQLVKKIVCKG